jgi:hypothetical protein
VISEALPAVTASPISHPSSRRAAWLITAPSDQLKAPELRYAEAICAASSTLASVHELAMEFRRMLKAHDANALTPWLNQAELELTRLRGHFTLMGRRSSDAEESSRLSGGIPRAVG